MYSSRRRRLQSPPRRTEDVQFSGSLTMWQRSDPSMEASMNTARKTKSDIVIVIMQDREKLMDRFGVAMHDVRYPEVDICEFVDSREYSRLKTMIQVNRSFDIVLQHGNNERGQSKLLGDSLVTAFPDALIQSIGSKYFKCEKGAQSLNLMMNKHVSQVTEQIFEKSLALGAFNVLLKYINETRNIYFRLKSLKIQEIVIDDTCMIDCASWDSLEIVDLDDVSPTKHQFSQRRTLLAVLDHTVTANGARLLRSNILQPSTDLYTIENRLDAVIELNEKPQLRDKLRNLLSRAHDLDRIMAMCIQTTASWTVRGAESNVNQIVKLAQTLKVISAMRDTMQNIKLTSKLLLDKMEFLNDDQFEEMMSILDETISDQHIQNKKNSLALKNVKCFAIKEGVSINLDVARKAYLELLNKVDEVGQQEINQQFGQDVARLSYSQIRGFHYTVPTRDAQRITIPRIFSEVVRNRSTVTFSSKKMMSINNRIETTVAEVFLASDIVVSDIVERIQHILPVLYYAMDALSTIDFLCSLATYSNARDTVRPEFGTQLSVSQGRHPILDWANSDKTVTNDTCLTRDRRFGIITGPNMGGKSTYLKQVALLSIIAQSGCPVPADFASLPVFNRIFSRMGHNDELVRNKSAFACEMRDASTILKHADMNSLVVMDELARSTSTEEGIAITYAICERILTLDCYTLLATHFLDLWVLANQSTAVENYHFRPSSETREDKIMFRHKLMRGPYRGPLYGFEVVEMSTFPEEVICHAETLAKHLRAQSSDRSLFDFNAERKRVKVYMWNRIEENVEMFMEKFGENWKTNSECVKTITALRQHLIEELNKINKLEQNSISSCE
ncbi:unnamed protein product [Caenorhabditis angaria]|uniref:DNA mismatch repair proteins mutS family domain-containing protein n=1 Tax=Caenorhabditis angaria TaxID=860376 RepID=A0A9P1MW46_9PELO|nr:unnamed protein product [Caenorhabditis angaria]